MGQPNPWTTLVYVCVSLDRGIEYQSERHQRTIVCCHITYHFDALTINYLRVF